jgi:hydroxymethylglutaryl-CoA lyase
MLQAVLDVASPDRLAGHFHDTRGRALDNVRVALDYGLRVFDASCGGLGGCPYAPGAQGNVATDRVVARLAELGFATGLDRQRLAEAAAFARGLRAPVSAEIHR